MGWGRRKVEVFILLVPLVLQHDPVPLGPPSCWVSDTVPSMWPSGLGVAIAF